MSPKIETFTWPLKSSKLTSRNKKAKPLKKQVFFRSACQFLTYAWWPAVDKPTITMRKSWISTKSETEFLLQVKSMAPLLKGSLSICFKSMIEKGSALTSYSPKFLLCLWAVTPNKAQEWIYRLLERILYTCVTTTDQFAKTQAAAEIQAVHEVALVVAQYTAVTSVQITQACQSPVVTTVN